jgi:hypothetical protein
MSSDKGRGDILSMALSVPKSKDIDQGSGFFVLKGGTVEGSCHGSKRQAQNESRT